MRRSDAVKVLVIVVALSGLMAFLLPELGRLDVLVDRTPSRRSHCKNNLKNIGVALHNYHNTYGSLPPAYVADDTGRPIHSWRVLLLPFIDQKPLYDKYDFSVPWNHLNNRRILDAIPEIYCCPSDEEKADSTTSYFACFGPGCAFQGEEPVRSSDMTDGQTNSLMVGEAARMQVPWTKPEDIDGAKMWWPGGLSEHSGGAHFLLADGSVRFITDTIDPEVLRKLFTINDGNEIPDF